MGGGRKERVLTGIDENGKEIYQPANSFYAEEYWEGVASGSIVLQEEEGEDE